MKLFSAKAFKDIKTKTYWTTVYDLPLLKFIKCQKRVAASDKSSNMRLLYSGTGFTLRCSDQLRNFSLA